MPAQSTYGGYCYLNNAALAAQALRDRGHARVAVLDIDYHHGNGTQDIFWERDDVLFVSIHGDPATEYLLGYADERGAGAGEGFTRNPLPRGTGWAVPRVKCAGRGRPSGRSIGSFATRPRAFPMISQRVAALGLPTVLVQEGGYAVAEIGDIVADVLGAFA